MTKLPDLRRTHNRRRIQVAPQVTIRIRVDHMQIRTIALLAISCGSLLHAGDADLPAPDPTGPWSWKGKLGVFFQNVTSHNAETSRDPSISGSVDNQAFTASSDNTLVWKEELNRVEQRLQGDYGQIKNKDKDEWEENTDRIAYGITYERTLSAPQFIYLNGTAESVFTGSDPDNEPLDPLIAKLSTGYGHRYENLLPLKDSLVWRVGVYARKRWEHGAPGYQTDQESGPEAYARYERTQNEDVSYYAQVEIYSEFADPQHVSFLGQAGLSVKVSKLLSVEVKLRAYDEARPDDASSNATGYNELSLREDALIGLAWTFASP
jgi:hypothetical protein